MLQPHGRLHTHFQPTTLKQREDSSADCQSDPIPIGSALEGLGGGAAWSRINGLASYIELKVGLFCVTQVALFSSG